MAKKTVKKSKKEIDEHMSRNRNIPKPFIRPKEKFDYDKLPPVAQAIFTDYDPKKDRTSDEYVDPELVLTKEIEVDEDGNPISE